MFTEAISRAVLNSLTLAALAFLPLFESPVQSESAPTPSRIQANSNRSPAGKLENGTLMIHLELRQGDWYPEADTGSSMKVYAFAEEGKALQVPGPLIRVPEGTDIHVTLHNLLGATAVLHGLHQHPGDAKAVVEVPPQETRELRFTAGAAGTYQYYASAGGDWATPVAPFERTVNLREPSSLIRGAERPQIGFSCWDFGGADPKPPRSDIRSRRSHT